MDYWDQQKKLGETEGLCDDNNVPYFEAKNQEDITPDIPKDLQKNVISFKKQSIKANIPQIENNSQGPEEEDFTELTSKNLARVYMDVFNELFC